MKWDETHGRIFAQRIAECFHGRWKIDHISMMQDAVMIQFARCQVGTWTAAGREQSVAISFPKEWVEAIFDIETQCSECGVLMPDVKVYLDEDGIERYCYECFHRIERENAEPIDAFRKVRSDLEMLEGN